MIKKQNELIMILGPMWSFKTTTLKNFIVKKEKEGQKFYVFAPVGTQRKDRPFLENVTEVRWEKNFKNNEQKDTLPLIASSEDFEEKTSKLKLDSNTWIAIDEIHFFEKNMVEVLKKMKEKCNIIVAGLMINYTSRLFETPLEIAKECATKIIQKQANCYLCFETCDYYIKLPGTKEGIGGAETYRPTCYRHFFLKSKTLRW